MSCTLSSPALVALCTHLRNVAKAAEVVGCTKSRKPSTSATLSLEHRDGSRFLVVKGSDGSDMVAPMMKLDAAALGSDVLALVLGITGASTARDQSADHFAALQAEYADHDATRAQLAEVTARLEALTKANAQPKVAPIVQRLEAAKADHGSLLDAIVAETAKPAHKPALAVASARMAVAVKAAPKSAVEVLTELEGRTDVEIESREGRPFRVTFLPRANGKAVQGVGIGDALKARAFKYSGKLSVGGRLVWER